jgi:capsular exopolysaccharide synthesis family protein
MRYYPDTHFQTDTPLASAFGVENAIGVRPVGRDDDGGIDLRALWGVLYRNWMLIAAVLAVAMMGGIASILLTSPSYRAKATIQVDQQTHKLLGTEDVEPAPSAQEADRFLQTQVDILKSRAIAGTVARKLRLEGNPVFLKDTGISDVDRADSKKLKELVIEGLQENLSVSLPRNSRVISIGFDSHDPGLAARISNTISETFIASNLERRFETSSYSRAFLQKQLAATKVRLEDSERALIDYARSAQLIDASEGIAGDSGQKAPQSLTTSNLVRLNSAYSDARATRVQAQQRWQQAQATPLMSLPEVLQNQAIQELTQKRAEMQASYQQERQRHKPAYPTVQQAVASLKEIDRQIATLGGQIRLSLRDNFIVAQRQEQALESNVNALKGETLAEQDRGVRYNILKREVDTNRELYDGLLQRFKEVSAQAGATDNNISIVDRAVPPLEPIAPKPSLNMALAGLAGLIVALAGVFAREKLDDAFRSPDDIENKLHMPLLGVVPALKDKASLQAAFSNPKSALSESYHALRTSLELSSAKGLPFTLLFTSTGQGEGKSTTAFALARNFAASGKRVLLIDADLRRPSMHRWIVVSNNIGLSNVLARHKTFAEVVQTSKQYNMHFVPSGPLPPNPAELFAGEALSELFAQLREDYDLVVIDGPPVLGLADSPRLARATDAALFIVQANGTSRGNAKAALKRLLDARVNLIGAVLTKFDAKKVGYGADYAYGYSYDYGSDKKRNRA